MQARTRFLIGALIVVGAVLATFVRIELPPRPGGQIEDIQALSERERPLNVVFILIDMLRADRLSAYGYERETTPRIDHLVSTGVRFAHTEAHSSWTKSSMASLWTGVLPPRTGILRFDDGLVDDVKMPAEIFKEAGYRTAGIWRNGWVASNFGFDQGFDLYLRPAPRAQDNFEKPLPGTRRLPGTDADVSRAAVEFLKSHGKDPFLLYLHYMDVHQYAYDPEAAAQGWGSSLSDAYDASIHWTDRHVDWIVRELEDLDLMKDTIVVIGSDHGEAFREHRREGHAHDLYREVTEVPFIMILPFSLQQELVVEPLVRNVDIWPTLLDMLGLPALEQTDGQSLVPLMLASARGEAMETPVSVSYIDQRWGRMEQEASPLVGIRKDGRRLMWKPADPDKTLQIYDLETDPGEKRNLAKSPPEWADELRADLEARLELPLAWGEADQVEIDEMYKAQLRALGYVVN